MTPIVSPISGLREFDDMVEHMPDTPDMKIIRRQVKAGQSIVWMERKDTLMVTTTIGDTLFISLVFSGKAGAIARNFMSVVEFVEFSSLRYIKCDPLGAAQARLYRWFGFEKGADGIMVLDTHNKE